MFNNLAYYDAAYYNAIAVFGSAIGIGLHRYTQFGMRYFHRRTSEWLIKFMFASMASCVSCTLVQHIIPKTTIDGTLWYLGLNVPLTVLIGYMC